MGYAATNIVVYGVEVNDEIAKALYEQFVGSEFIGESEEENPDFTGEFIIPGSEGSFLYRKNIEGRTNQKTPVTPYKEHDNGCGDYIFNPALLSEGTDSRIDNLTYDAGYSHVFGIQIASKGYAYDDDIMSFIKKTPQKAIDNFNTYIAPVLAQYKITEQPEIKLVMQTW